MNYTCTNDLQGTGFACGRTLTIEGWREQGLDWAYMDDYDGIYEELSKLPKKKVIDYIQDFWELEIYPTDTIEDWELKDLMNFGMRKPTPKDSANRKNIIKFLKNNC